MTQRAPQAHFLVICGPAGCGKSTVGRILATDFNFLFIEGDEYHTEDAIRKMSNNIPLTDTDRWEWLVSLRKQAARAVEEGAPGVVLSCSALKRKYRDVIRTIALEPSEVAVHFIYLRADPRVLLQRVRARTDHYMKESMVSSQLDNLEEPQSDESDVVAVDVGETAPAVCKTVKDIVKSIIR